MNLSLREQVIALALSICFQWHNKKHLVIPNSIGVFHLCC